MATKWYLLPNSQKFAANCFWVEYLLLGLPKITLFACSRSWRWKSLYNSEKSDKISLITWSEFDILNVARKEIDELNKKEIQNFSGFSAFFDVKHSLNKTLLKEWFKPMHMIDLKVSKTTICVKGIVTACSRKIDTWHLKPSCHRFLIL